MFSATVGTFIFLMMPNVAFKSLVAPANYVSFRNDLGSITDVRLLVIGKNLIAFCQFFW
jgi:hypothetical protein